MTQPIDDPCHGLVDHGNYRKCPVNSAQPIDKAAYNSRVVDNIHLCARTKIPAEYIDPVTGNKLYNQASLNEAVTAVLKRVDAELPEDKPYGKDTPDEYTEQWHDGFNSAVGIGRQAIQNQMPKLEEADA